MALQRMCRQCGSTRKGEEFADGTGYECPDCMSNVFTDGSHETDEDFARVGPRLFSRPDYVVGSVWR